MFLASRCTFRPCIVSPAVTRGPIGMTGFRLVSVNMCVRPSLDSALGHRPYQIHTLPVLDKVLWDGSDMAPYNTSDKNS